MRRSPLVFLVVVALAPSLLASPPTIRWVDFDTDVTSATAERILGAIDDAEREGNDLVIVRLDTPGGLVDALDTIVKRMLATKVPVVVWVAPSGARAASAGFIMLIAADVPAMAPGTRTGAASPITLSGPNREGDVLLKKAANDMAALARSIAEHRGRNVEKCEKAVLAAEAYTDEFALREGLIDLVARDRDDLLHKLHGRTIKRFDGTAVTLATEGATFVTSERTWQQEFWEALASPTIAFFLLMLGLVGVYTELTHPGVILPGLVGVFCLLLFALSTQVLPVSMIGLLLILLGIVMFILELKVTSHGMLTLGGVVSLVAGSVLLFPGPIPELRLPIFVVLPASLTLAAFCAVAVRLSVAARKTPVSTGVEGLRGEMGVVTQDLEPEGKVFVHGEIWNAVASGATLPKGTAVRVTAVENMRLEVEPAKAGDPRGASR